MGVVQAIENKLGLGVGDAYNIPPEILDRYNSTLAGTNNPFFDMTKPQQTGYTTGPTIFTQNLQGMTPTILPEGVGGKLNITG